MQVQCKEELSTSVVVPFYNRSRFAVRLLESVINQTVKPTHIYIIDNGSNPIEIEKLHKIIRSLAFGEIEVVLASTLKVGNANYARNLGAELSNTRFVAFLDSDDWWEKTHLEDSIKKLMHSNKAGVYSGAVIHKDGVYKNKSYDINSYNNPYPILSSRKGFIAQTSSYVIDKTNLPSGVRWDEKLKRHQDYDFFLSVFHQSTGWVFLDRPSSHIDWEDGGAKKNVDYRSMIRFLIKWRSQIPKEELAQYIYNQFLSCGRNECHPMYLKYYKKYHKEISNPVISSFLCSKSMLLARKVFIQLINKAGVKLVIKKLIAMANSKLII